MGHQRTSHRPTIGWDAVPSKRIAKGALAALGCPGAQSSIRFAQSCIMALRCSTYSAWLYDALARIGVRQLCVDPHHGVTDFIEGCRDSSSHAMPSESVSKAHTVKCAAQGVLADAFAQITPMGQQMPLRGHHTFEQQADRLD